MMLALIYSISPKLNCGGDYTIGSLIVELSIWKDLITYTFFI
jgi:hypothetical protein